MNYKQQQKQANKYFRELMNEFTKEELAKMLMRARKQKNQYLSEREQYKKVADINQSSINELIPQLETSESQRLFLADQTQELFDTAEEYRVASNKLIGELDDDIKKLKKANKLKTKTIKKLKDEKNY